MENRFGKKRPHDVDRLVKSVVDLVTGNPITEDVSPLADKKRRPPTDKPDWLGRKKGDGRGRR